MLLPYTPCHVLPQRPQSQHSDTALIAHLFPSSSNADKYFKDWGSTQTCYRKTIINFLYLNSDLKKKFKHDHQLKTLSTVRGKTIKLCILMTLCLSVYTCLHTHTFRLLSRHKTKNIPKTFKQALFCISTSDYIFRAVIRYLKRWTFMFHRTWTANFSLPLK